MPKEITRIEFTEEELKTFLAERFDISSKTATLNIVRSEGDKPHDITTYTISIEGVKEKFPSTNYMDR